MGYPDLAPSDVAILDLLRKRESLTVADLADLLEVTATAVRQRLNRLMGQGFIERRASRGIRGRPSHHYVLTESGRRNTGSNFADLAVALWEEVRAIQDHEVRKGLLQRIAQRMAESYRDKMHGATLAERMQSVAALFRERGIPFECDSAVELPVLTALACPYPGLAESDRTVCSMERLALSEMLGESMRLTSCRLDGEGCCTFEPSHGGKYAKGEESAGNAKLEISPDA
jgi:DeoR family suf operon transcriptional repressor